MSINPQRARAIRQRRRMNQLEFWSRVGVTQSGGSRYESGRRIPAPVQKLLTIAYGPATRARRAYQQLRAN